MRGTERFPSIRLDLGKVRDNVSDLVGALAARGISLTGVTKAALGHPSLGEAFIHGGAVGLADSRIDNIERLRAGGIDAPILLLRSPMGSEVDRIVRSADASCNSEESILTALSHAAAAAQVTHGVLLMVELGDLREGILPQDLLGVVESTLDLAHINIVGIGTNLACRSGVVPDEANMAALSALADQVEDEFGVSIDTVSGGNSANIDWLTTVTDTGRITDLRIGEAALLGCEPLHRRPIPGLHVDTATIRAEVIESKRKPTRPSGARAQSAFGIVHDADAALEGPGDTAWQTIVALGHQDTDPGDLTPPPGITILGASSDHLVLRTPTWVAPGRTIDFRPGYGALLRAMTSPFMHHDCSTSPPDHD